MSTTADASGRRAQLVAAKLAALAAQHGGGQGPASGLGAAAGLLVGDEAWVLVDQDPERGLGGALAWAVRRGAARLHVLADVGTGTLARRAEGFRLPIRVSHVEGRDLLPAVAEPLVAPVAVRPEHGALRELIVAGGADPVEEHGVLAGEVRGLEVCRVVDDPVSGEVRLEVGIGAHDREVFQMLHAERPTVEALADVVGSVARHRVDEALQHPLNQLAASRRLRARLVEDPSLVRAASVEPVQPPVPRPNVKDQAPAAAVAHLHGGGLAVVVCTTGVDLDVVPWSVDAVAAQRATGAVVAECLIAAPRRDVVDIQERLAALCVVPTRLVPIDPVETT